MKTIGIIGSRQRDSQEDLEACRKVFLSIYKEGDTLVSGGCPRGGDRFCEVFAKEYNIPIKIHYANWDKYGKSAGYKRNIFIAEDSDVIIAVVSMDRKGGTEDTIKKAENMGKSVLLVENLENLENLEELENPQDIDDLFPPSDFFDDFLP